MTDYQKVYPTRKKAIGAATNLAIRLLHGGHEVKMHCWSPRYVSVYWYKDGCNEKRFLFEKDDDPQKTKRIRRQQKPVRPNGEVTLK